jgi:hypothetical protein
MRVLVLEAQPGAADRAAAALEAAAHTVDRCHDVGTTGFPCRAVDAPGACPLESQPVAVALTVRPPGSSIQALEDGVACAIRAHVPLVVAGETDDNPYRRWTAAIAPGARDDDIVAACEHAAAAPLPRHTQAASERLRRLLRHRDIAGAETARVEVTRHEGRLRIRILLPDAVPSSVVQAAGTYVLAEVHALDPTARGADVSLGTV